MSGRDSAHLQIVESLNAAVFVVDRNGDIAAWNTHAAALTGLDSGGAIGTSIDSLLSDGSFSGRLDSLVEVLETGTSFAGRWTWTIDALCGPVDVTLAACRDDGTGVIGALGVLVPVPAGAASTATPAGGFRAEEPTWRRLRQELRNALAGGDFSVHYQPVVDLDGRIRGLEALSRWEHPVRGAITPGEFIPLAESTGMIVELGTWVLDEACREVAAWRELPGCEDLTVAVNLSGRQLAEPTLPRKVRTILRAHGLDPSALVLEMTESVLMDDAMSATAKLMAVHDLGVGLAVDDFGTGYSSLLYLRRFPVDALKVDRFFVSGIHRNEQDAAIVRAVISLAHSLGLTAIAEGVESREQIEDLREVGCDLAQGFYWSPAVPAADITRMLLAQTPLVGAPPQPPLPVCAIEPPPTTATNRATVCLIDDSEGERSLLYSHLESSGYFRVVGDAGDGATGVMLTERTKPDLVLLDMAMPGMDGLEALPLLRVASPTSRVVLLSGFMSPGMSQQVRDGGAVAVLDKGAGYPAIIEALRACVADTVGAEADAIGW